MCETDCPTVQFGQKHFDDDTEQTYGCVFCAPEVATAEVVVDCSCDLNRVEKLSKQCRVCYSEQLVNVVEFTERSSVKLVVRQCLLVDGSSSAVSLVVAKSFADCKSVHCQ